MIFHTSIQSSKHANYKHSSTTTCKFKLETLQVVPECIVKHITLIVGIEVDHTEGLCILLLLDL